MQLAFEEQEKSSSALAPGSLRPCYPFTKPLHPYTKHKHNRGKTSYSKLKELGRSLPRRS
jgi:hypothetical protein